MVLAIGTLTALNIRAEFSKPAGDEWEVSTIRNRMTDQVDVKANSVQGNWNVVAHIEAVCGPRGVALSVLIVDWKGNATIEFPKMSYLVYGQVPAIGLQTLYRINRGVPQTVILPQLEYANKFLVAVLVTGSKPSAPQDYKVSDFMGNMLEGLYREFLKASGSNIYLDAKTTRNIMVEIETTNGSIIIEAPLMHSAIQSVITACK